MHFDQRLFWDALTSYAYLEGASITILLALISHGIAIVIAIPMAILLDEPKGLASFLVRQYVGIFRAIPTLLQLLFVWNALPQLMPIFNRPWFTPFIAAVVALSLNEAAYQVEINSSAIQSVDRGQYTAGLALGLRRFQISRLVMLPQALRVAVPPTANEFITMLKLTSLASVVSLRELMTVTSQSVATTFQFTEYYAAALVYYLVMVYVLSWFQARLERRFDWSKAGHGTQLSVRR
jgi:polar amino acid transport system permease protein